MHKSLESLCSNERRDFQRHGADPLVTLHRKEQEMTPSKPQRSGGRECSLTDLPLRRYPCLDSLLLQLPRDTVMVEQDFKWNRRIHGESGTIALEYPKNALPLGVNFLRIELTAVRIAISSKILAQRYKELISWSSIDHVLKKLESIPGITFDLNHILDYAQVMRVDVTRDVVVSGYPADYLQALSLATTRPGFVCERYYAHRPTELETVVFTRRLGNRTDRLSVYWKFPELQKAKNKRIRQHLNPYTMWPVLRVEVNLRNFASIRKAFDVPSPQKLFDILTSERDPVASRFAEVLPTQQLSLDSGTDSKLIDIEKREGRKAILAQLDWDVNRTKQFVRTHGPKSNRARTLGPYMQLIEERRSQQRAELDPDDGLEEMREKLSERLCLAEELRHYGGEV